MTEMNEQDVLIAADAVGKADAAFRSMSTIGDDQIGRFFELFADRLRDENVWAEIVAANDADVARAESTGRSTTRLKASAKMRDAMIDGLLGWAKSPSRRGEVIERREGDDWTIERRRAPLGVVAFVFEGRPNVFADGVGVLRGGNTCVMRIGSDALGTAEAIETHAVQPALEAAGLPEGAVVLVRSPSRGAGHALFSQPRVRLAIARGSGPAVAELGATATQHGIPVSLHGTGGAWMYVADDASAARMRSAIVHSLDRKVCNTLNTLVIQEGRPDLIEHAVAALRERDPGYVLHVAAGAETALPEGTYADVIAIDDLRLEWEWEDTPELSLVLAPDDDRAAGLINTYSPRFVASILTADTARFERFYERVDAPYVGDGFTRWVDGQWAWDRPELGLSNWERGRILGRSGILSGDDVYTVRDVFRDQTGHAPQHR